MPAEPERQVGEHLGRLRSDVDHVGWAGAAAVRARGDRRTRNHAVAGALTTLAVLGAAGFGFFGGPFRASTEPTDLAGRPLEAPAYSSSAANPSEPGSDTPSAEEESTAADAEPDTNSSSEPAEETPEDETRAEPSTSTTTSDDAAETADTETPKSESPTTPPAGSTTTTPTDEETTTPSGSPTTTTTPPLSTTSAGALLLPPANMYVVGGSSGWSAGTTRQGESGTVAHCQASTLTALGADSVVRRDYTHSGDPAITGDHVVGTFETDEDAIAAYDSLSTGVGDCDWDSSISEPGAVAVDGGSAQWWHIQREGDGTTGESEVIGLVRRGNAVSLVAMYQPGMTYDDDPAPTLDTAWELLDPES